MTFYLLVSIVIMMCSDSWIGRGWWQAKLLEFSWIGLFLLLLTLDWPQGRFLLIIAVVELFQLSVKTPPELLRTSVSQTALGVIELVVLHLDSDYEVIV